MIGRACYNSLDSFKKVAKHILSSMNKLRNVVSLKIHLKDNSSLSIMTNISNLNLIKCINTQIAREAPWVYRLMQVIGRLVKVVVLLMKQLKRQDREIQVLFVETLQLVVSFHWEICFKDIMKTESMTTLKRWEILTQMSWWTPGKRLLVLCKILEVSRKRKLRKKLRSWLRLLNIKLDRVTEVGLSRTMIHLILQTSLRLLLERAEVIN